MNRTNAGGLQLEAAPLPPLVLTELEMSFLLAFRTMDDRAKHETFRMAERQAARWPRLPVARLRLVDGGAK